MYRVIARCTPINTLHKSRFGPVTVEIILEYHRHCLQIAFQRNRDK